MLRNAAKLALAIAVVVSGSPAVLADGTLILARPTAIQTLVPVPVNTLTMPWRRAVYDSLVVWQDGGPKPGLAASWSMSADNRTLKLKLQNNVKFHDGATLDAARVIASLEWAADPKNGANGAAMFAGATFAAPDSSTVVISFALATPQALSVLVQVPIVDPTIDLATTENGTGPFKLQEFLPGVSLRLEKNDDYWGMLSDEGISAFEVRALPDQAAAMAALTSGQVDGLALPASGQIPTLKDAGINIMQQEAPGNFELFVNASSEKLADKRVRQALSLAVRRDLFASRMGGGVSTPTCSIFPKGSAVYELAADENCSFDLEKAKSLLAEAGYASGLQLSMIVSSTQTPEWAEYAPLLKEDLASIGVELSIEEIEPSVRTQRMFAGEFELTGGFYGGGIFDPAVLFADRTFAPANLVSRFTEPAYAEMVARAQAELDPAIRLNQYKELNLYMIDQAFIIPVASRPYIYALTPQVKGFAFDPFGLADVTGVSVAR